MSGDSHLTEERRRQPVPEEWLQSVIETAARKGGEEAATAVLNQLSPHDLTTYAGKKTFQADLLHVHETRMACAKVKESGLKYTIGTALTVVVTSFVVYFINALGGKQ